jgi:hypothetical protein
VAAHPRSPLPPTVARRVAGPGRPTPGNRTSTSVEYRGAGGLHRAAFGCLALAIALFTVNALRVSQSLSFGDPLLVVAGGFVAVRYVQRGLPRAAIPVWLPAASAAILLAGLIAAFRGDVGADLVPTLEFAGTLFAMPVIAVVLIDTPRRLERTVDGWLLAASLSALVGAADLAGHLNIGLRLTNLDFVLYTHRAPGLTLHPNHLGLVSAMALPVALTRAIRPVAPGAGLGFTLRNLGYALALAIGILVSGSRSGLLAAVVALVALPLLQDARRRVGWLVALPVIVIGMLGVVVLDSSLAASLGIVTGSRLTGSAAGTNISDDYRVSAYGSALHQIAQDPIVGQGFGVARVAHDIYIQLLQAGGIIALGAFLLVVAGAFRVRREIERRPARTPSSDLAVACNASLIAWLVNGALQNQLYDRYLYIPLGLLLAIGEMNRRLSVRRARPVTDPSWGDQPGRRPLAASRAP